MSSKAPMTHSPRYTSRLSVLLGILGFTLMGCGDDLSAEKCAPIATPEGPVAKAAPSAAKPPATDAGPTVSPPVVATPAPTPTPIPTPPAPVILEDPTPKVSGAIPAAPVAEKLSKLEVEGPLGVLEAAIGTGVEKRAPSGVASAFGTDVGKVWAFIKVKNRGEPTKVTMVWKKAGKEAWRIDLRVGTSRGWRTWSRKRVSKRDAGDWSVDIVTSEGDVLHTLEFTIDPEMSSKVAADAS